MGPSIRETQNTKERIKSSTRQGMKCRHRQFKCGARGKSTVVLEHKSSIEKESVEQKLKVTLMELVRMNRINIEPIPENTSKRWKERVQAIHGISICHQEQWNHNCQHE